MRFASRLLFCLFSLWGVGTAWSQLSESENNTLKLQIYLNSKNFGPGYLDAKAGQFTMLAIKNYNLSRERSATDFRYVQEAQAEVNQTLITTIIPSSASKFIDASLPSNRFLQSKRKFMPYRSYAEYLAERYHTSVSFLKKINKGKIHKLGPRSVVQVPNVEPFLIENLSHGRSHKATEELRDRHVVIDTSINQIKIYQKAFTVPAPPQPHPFANRTVESLDDIEEYDAFEASTSDQQKVIPAEITDEEVFASLQESDLVASFPITPGKPQFIRRGFWKVKNAIELPIWRYDKSLLETGVSSKDALIIPGGPNNPVGVIWHGLTRKGIGIHGTSSPETIGRSKSAGCIRLSNWDAIKLPSLIRPGCRVWLK